jgi:hypothetical protein
MQNCVIIRHLLKKYAKCKDSTEVVSVQNKYLESAQREQLARSIFPFFLH